MLLKWTCVVLSALLCERFVNGYSANPFFEDVHKLEECGAVGCLITKPGQNLPAICHVPGRSSNRNVTFRIENERYYAQRLEQGERYKAPAYTVKENDHLKVLTCHVQALDGTGSSEVQAKLFVSKASTTPVFQEKDNGQGLALSCSTRNGRPPPELEFTVDENKLEIAIKNSDEAIELSSVDELQGKKITCCTKSPFYSTQCSDHTISKKRGTNPTTTRHVTRKQPHPDDVTTKLHQDATPKMTSSRYITTSEVVLKAQPEEQGPNVSTMNRALNNVITAMAFALSILTSLATMISF